MTSHSNITSQHVIVTLDCSTHMGKTEMPPRARYTVPKHCDVL
jgi:hypothetical protein